MTRMIRRLLLHRPLPLASFATGPRPHLPHHEERGRPSTSLELGARRGFSTRDFLKKIDDMLEDDKGARGAKGWGSRARLEVGIDLKATSKFSNFSMKIFVFPAS